MLLEVNQNSSSRGTKLEGFPIVQYNFGSYSLLAVPSNNVATYVKVATTMNPGFEVSQVNMSANAKLGSTRFVFLTMTAGTPKGGAYPGTGIDPLFNDLISKEMGGGKGGDMTQDTNLGQPGKHIIRST